jgi:hypothetical protein
LNALSLTIRATEDDLHTLQLALVGLREIVRPGTLRIALTVQAERDGEIDRAQYQNRVRQHLEEDPDMTFESRGKAVPLLARADFPPATTAPDSQRASTAATRDLRRPSPAKARLDLGLVRLA